LLSEADAVHILSLDLSLETKLPYLLFVAHVYWRVQSVSHAGESETSSTNLMQVNHAGDTGVLQLWQQLSAPPSRSSELSHALWLVEVRMTELPL